MTANRNPLEVYAALPKTNCGQCPPRTCLAFASAIVRGDKQPADHGQEVELQRLGNGVAAIDFAASTERLGAILVGERLGVKALGRDFLIGRDGSIVSQCHTHAGLAIPLLRYVLFSRGGRPTGQWLPFRELEHAAGRNLHFEQMCEKPLKRLVDSHTELLKDLIDIFSAERSVNLFGSDISLVLFPLPRIPVLICYWGPEEGMESSLHIFFDITAADHLSVEWIHSLCAGLVTMFEKIALKHV